MMKWIFRSV